MKSAEIPMTDFSLNGQPVQALPGESIWQVAQRVGVAIPHLCHKPGLPSAGNCRACVVEVEGERVLAASCCRTVADGMQVLTDSPRARTSQRMVLELLQADLPETALTRHNEVDEWSQRLGVGKPRFAPRPGTAPRRSAPPGSRCGARAPS